MKLESEFKSEKDRGEIDKLTTKFFKVFTNKEDKKPNIAALRELVISEGIIINNTNATPLIFNLDNFIKPREEMLTNGTLTDFTEHETASKTDVFGDIAQRFCEYEKSGKLNGVSFYTTGTKSIQFIRVGRIWKISSVIWCDKL